MPEPVSTGIIAFFKEIWFLIVGALGVGMYIFKLRGDVNELKEGVKQNRQEFRENDKKHTEQLNIIHEDIKQIIWKLGGKDDR